MATKTDNEKNIGLVRVTKSSKIIITVFLIVAVILTLGIVLYSSMKTSVTVVRETFPVKATLVADIAQKPGAEEIKGWFSLETISESTTTTDLSGDSTVKGKAKGTIKVVNNSKKDQPLQATTRFITADGILFRSTERVDAPAGGSATVPVEADQPGPVGDIKDGTRFSIPGLWKGLQESIFGQAQGDFSGGEKNSRVVTADDIASAKTATEKKLETKAQDLPLPKDATDDAKKIVIQTEMLSEQSSISAGTVSDSFTFTVRARYMVLALDKDSLYQKMYDALKTTMTSDEELLTLNVADIKPEIVRYSTKDNTSQVRLSVSGNAQLGSHSATLQASAFVNKTKDDLSDIVEQQIGIKSISASFAPFWLHATPGTATQIRVIIK